MPHKEVFLNGKKVPSVTEIKAMLPQDWKWAWYKNSVMKRGKMGWIDCEKRSETGREIGTLFHDKAYNYIVSKRLPKRNDKIRPLVESFKKWYDTCGMTPIDLEPEDPLVSKEYRYQGTYDCVFKIKNTNSYVIADWKTSNKIDKDFGIQLAAYAYLFGESKGWKAEDTWHNFNRGLVVRIDKKTAKSEIKWFDNLQEYFSVFLALREAYDFVHSTGRWELNNA